MAPRLCTRVLAFLLIVCGVHAVDARAVEPGVGEPEAGSWTHTQRLLGAWSDAVDVAFVGDGRQVALVESWGRVTVWDFTTGLQAVSLRYNTSGARAIEIDAAGTRIAIGTPFGVTVWDTRPLRQYPSLPARVTNARMLAMSRDGAVVAAKAGSDEFHVWRLLDDTAARMRAPEPTNLTSVALSADGSLVAAGWANGTAEVWDTTDRELIMTARGHGNIVRVVGLAADGALLATGSDDGTAKVWDVATGALVGTYGPSRWPITGARLTNDGKRLITLRSGGSARMWDVDTGKPVRAYPRGELSPRHLALSPDGRMLAQVGDGYGIWATGIGLRLALANRSGRRPDGVQLSHDGGRVLAMHGRGYATLHDTANGDELRSFGAPGSADALAATYAAGITDPPGGAFHAVRILGDGRQVLEITRHDGIVVWDVASGRVGRRFDDTSEIEYPFVLSPDHRLLLTGGAVGAPYVWDVAAGGRLCTVGGTGARVLTASFDAVGKTLVTGGRDGSVLLWDARTGAPAGVVPSEAPGVYAVDVSPDGQYLLIARVHPERPLRRFPNASSHLWRLRTLEEIMRPRYNYFTSRGVAWSPDARRMYTLTLNGVGPSVKGWAPHDFSSLHGAAPTADANGMPAVWVRPNVRPAAPARRSAGPTVAAAAQAAVTLAERASSAAMQGVSNIAMSRDGSTFAHVTNEGCVDIWRWTAEN